MRLYNAASCTPVTTGAKWNPPKSFIPQNNRFLPTKTSGPSCVVSKREGISRSWREEAPRELKKTSREHDVVSVAKDDVAQVPSQTDSVQESSNAHVPVSDVTARADPPNRQAGTSGSFHFDIDVVEEQEDDSSGEEYDDSLSQMSSSTLSTKSMLLGDRICAGRDGDEPVEERVPPPHSPVSSDILQFKEIWSVPGTGSEGLPGLKLAIPGSKQPETPSTLGAASRFPSQDGRFGFLQADLSGESITPQKNTKQQPFSPFGPWMSSPRGDDFVSVRAKLRPVRNPEDRSRRDRKRLATTTQFHAQDHAIARSDSLPVGAFEAYSPRLGITKANSWYGQDNGPSPEPANVSEDSSWFDFSIEGEINPFRRASFAPIDAPKDSTKKAKVTVPIVQPLPQRPSPLVIVNRSTQPKNGLDGVVDEKWKDLADRPATVKEEVSLGACEWKSTIFTVKQASSDQIDSALSNKTAATEALSEEQTVGLESNSSSQSTVASLPKSDSFQLPEPEQQVQSSLSCREVEPVDICSDKLISDSAKNGSSAQVKVDREQGLRSVSVECLLESRLGTGTKTTFTQEHHSVELQMFPNSKRASTLTSQVEEIARKDATESADRASLGVEPQDHDDSVLAKYLKMLKVGLPKGAVVNAMKRDGVDPKLLDGSGKGSNGAGTSAKVLDDAFRRTRVHWNTHDTVRSNTLWAMIDRDPDVSALEVDEAEFESLFRAEKLTRRPATSSPSKCGSGVRVIDAKRANNGGIILANIKVPYDEIALAVDKIDDSVMTGDQIRAIIPFIPTDEERKALVSYMGKHGPDFTSECEKFMAAMIDVQEPKRKLEALLFIKGFGVCIKELCSDARKIHHACDELVASWRFRKVLGIILKLGNRLNTAGATGKCPARAITAESLTKLNQAKAFDRKTTFLQYVASVVKKAEPTLLRFQEDLPSLSAGENIRWSQVTEELESLETQLADVRRIAVFLGLDDGARSDFDASTYAQLDIEDEVEVLRSTSIGRFTLDACLQLADAFEHIEGARKAQESLLLYFGEEEQGNVQADSLLRTIALFTRQFDVACNAAAAAARTKTSASIFLAPSGDRSFQGALGGSARPLRQCSWGEI